MDNPGSLNIFSRQEPSSVVFISTLSVRVEQTGFRYRDAAGVSGTLKFDEMQLSFYIGMEQNIGTEFVSAIHKWRWRMNRRVSREALAVRTGSSL